MMDDMSDINALALDIDFRIGDIWSAVMELEEDELGFEVLGTALRAAYMHGYEDGRHDRNEFLIENGYLDI